jgi:DNA polymerase-1
MYQSGKNTHFALAYGAALEKLAQTAHLSLMEMEAGYDLYARRYPEIAFLARDGTKRVQRDGFIVTPFGRKLFIPADSPYAWLNYKIQGMAAEIIKRGQVNSLWYLQKFWSGVKPVMTIHDEIIYQVPLSIANDSKALGELSRGLDTCMTYVPQINVPLEVETKITYSTWDKAEEVSL